MGNKYVLIKTDGALVMIDGTVDVNAVAALANKNTTHAVKVGRKSVQRNMIAAIAPLDAVEKTEGNVIVQAMNTNLYATVENADDAITKLTDAINSKHYVVISNILICRGAYQCAEPIEEMTESAQ